MKAIGKKLAYFAIVFTLLNEAWSAEPNGLAVLQEEASRALAEPFKGLTTDSKVVPDLFKIAPTGASTRPLRDAAEAFLNGLTDEQRKKTTFPVNDEEWRKWDNRHVATRRQGISFKEMTDSQRELAFGILRAGLSAKGLQKAADIMKLNETLAELANDHDEYGEWLYYIKIMGVPSDTEPWGWQLDGHHANINYFILGDQAVMTPTFLGSEPVRASSGKFKGTVVLQDEQDIGVRLYSALDQRQRAKALIKSNKGPTENLAEACRDNLVLDYAGISASEMSISQREILVLLLSQYIDNIKEDSATVRMREIIAHLDQTYFAWIGGAGSSDVFYYRIQSPVILIEFDHQARLTPFSTNEGSRDHIHTVVRTPNGNDYGKDLLRQHYARHKH